MLLYRKKQGFSLIELLVVISIIGLIAGIGVSFIAAVQRNTRDTQRVADLQVLKSALQRYYADRNYFPDNLGNLLTTGLELTDCAGFTGGCTASKTYLSATPKDPAVGTATPYCYSSQYSVTDTAACSGATSGKCHYYNLCATLENPSAPTNCSCPNGGGGTGNTKVTPL